jgi:hypothetical protein
MRQIVLDLDAKSDPVPTAKLSIAGDGRPAVKD